MRSKKNLFIIGAPLTLLLLLIVGSNQQARDSFSNSIFNRSKESESFNKRQLSIDDPNSLWVVVNKSRPLNPTNYTPPDLVVPNVPLRYASDFEEMKIRSETASALEQMTASAKSEGVNLMLASGYRSYDLQTTVYNNFVGNQGKETADTQSARPGHSEHQTGLAIDLEPTDRSCEIEDCFATTKEGIWLAKNAYKFGFIVRYQPNKQAIVGYKYEPWHFRYVGKDLAAELNKRGDQTLEEFFGLPPSPNYN